MAAMRTDRPGRWRRSPLRGLSAVVLAAFTVVAVGLFVAAERLVSDQEDRLLDERTAEVGALLSNSVATGLQSSLTSLAVAAQQSPDAFTRAARPQLSPGGAIAVVARRGPDWVVQTAVGGLPAGQRLTGPRRALVGATRSKLHSDVFAEPGRQSRIGVAVGSPVTSAGTVVYVEAVVDPTEPTAVTRSQPFSELHAALYVGSRADPAKLILATSELPLPGPTSQQPIPVGDGSWLVVAAARQPLAGEVAANVPSILLLATLLIGLAMTVLVESVGRRRDYALTLVAQRTQALRESLQELRQTQQALVASERLAALGEMAATVGHELRNPLGVLTNSMFLIRNAVGPTPARRSAGSWTPPTGRSPRPP